MRHFSRAACKVSAIYAAPAALHFPNLKWDLGRCYHLERPRHLGKHISKGFAGYKMKITFFYKKMNKLYFQAGTSLCSTPKTCCKWAAVGTRENTPSKILFRSHMPKEQFVHYISSTFSCFASIGMSQKILTQFKMG